MSERPPASRAREAADYGIDAPGLVRSFLAAGAGAALGFAIANRRTRRSPPWARVLAWIPGLVAAYAIGMGALMLSWSKFVKIRDRERALNQILWRGDERVLDVGCGRGLMLVGAALRLTTGSAIGVDIWSPKDQSSNSSEAARENASSAGVSEKTDVRTADMRKLPYADRSFDVVMSHWVVHNVESADDRDLALSEMARVLRPGGRIIVCDIEHRDAYLAKLESLGFTDCRTTFDPIGDAVLGALSFGTFRPTTIVATSAT